MGEARRRELDARAAAFAKTDRCIFCGGIVEATTVDHCPPRSIFSNRKWPEGYVFPACGACNSGSKRSENWVAMMSRMHSGPEADEETSASELYRLGKPLMTPSVLKAMGLSANKKRELAKRIGVSPEPGETYAEMAFLAVPPEATAAVEVFAPKIAKALHFMHTDRIVPVAAAIRYRWFTNVNRMDGTLPDDVFTIPTGGPVLRRANVDLNDQFNY